MNLDSAEWFFGGAWIFAIIFLWLIYFGGLSDEQTIQVWPEVSHTQAIMFGLLVMFGFMIVMGWVQFQRRVSQYSAVTDFVLPSKEEKM